MTISAYETSRFSGEPINLYLFQCGEERNYFAYTDAEQAITFGTIASTGEPTIYQPIAIDRGKITESGTLDKTRVPITVPVGTPIGDLYLAYPPSSVTTVIIYQGHADDDDSEFQVVWSGIVTSCSRKGSKVELGCDPVVASLRRNGLRRRYQYGCPLVLYGSDCRADKVAATSIATVSAINGARITVTGDWPQVGRAMKFAQGMVEWTGPNGATEIRTILRVENGGLTFLLGGTASDLAAGGSVKMVLGCNHKSGTDAQPDGDCGPLHDNIQNFGGQERIPFKNPIGLINHFY